VVAAGVTTTGLPDIEPGDQLYELPPDAVSMVVKPAHTDGDDAVTESVGVGITVRVKVVTLLQPDPLVPVNV
jgi:hypothetical protein